MHSQLRERIRLMRARLDNAAPVAEIRAESQLFVTPAPVCDRLVMLAEISNRDYILEPSAGTGAILRAIRDTAPGAMCDAVEINSGLVRYLRENFNGVRGSVWRLHGMAAGAVLQPGYHESAVQPRAGYPAYPAGLFPVASGWRAGRRLSQRTTPAGEAVTVF